MRGLLFVIAATVASAATIGRETTAHADGGIPETLAIHFAADKPQSLYVMTSYGLMVSQDGGCTFDWICEQVIGYAGTSYIPQLAITGDGSIFATSFAGLRISRDGCTWDTKIASDSFVATVAVGADGAVWAASANGDRPNHVYVSRDNGETFSSVLEADVRWLSVREDFVAGVDMQGVAHVRRRDGETWTPLSTAGIVLNASVPKVTIGATSPLFVVSHGAVSNVVDKLYRWSGTAFEEVFSVEGTITDVVAHDGKVIVASRVRKGLIYVGGPASISIDGGMTFGPFDGAPTLSCVAVSPDRELVGCGANWEPDFMAVARREGDTWKKVWRFVELNGPLACPAGSPGDQMCGAQWPSLQNTLLPNGPTCGVHAKMPDGPPDDPPEPGSCCSATGPEGIALAAFVAWWIGRRRRRRR